jgi:translocator assembly and maintenance protein 41
MKARDAHSADGQMASAEHLEKLLENTFPQEEIVYAFGYGSGVFSQHLNIDNQAPSSKDNNDSNDNIMIDIILVVRDSYKFHRDNLSKNPQHYVSTWLAADKAARITWWQRHSVENAWFSNPRVYFNVTKGLKYGVVPLEDLQSDLQHWKYLYLAGRMQKPTLPIIDRLVVEQLDDSIPRILYQQTHNLPAALSAALLLQPQTASGSSCSSSTVVSPTQIYTTIASLSYTGDFRTAIGAEDPQKITKLVSAPGQLQRFHSLYQSSVDLLVEQGVLQRSSTPITDDNDDDDGQEESIYWSIDSSTAAKDHLWSHLPQRLQHQDHLQAALTRIVAPAARYQSIKGLASAGFSQSAAYAARKLSKGIFRFIK